MRKSCLVGLAVALCIAAAPAVQAVNSVVVTSQSVPKGATGVTIPVLLVNDVTLSALTVPLAIREVTAGCYISSLTLTYGDRLPEGVGQPLGDFSVRNQYADENGTCKNGQPGGFGTITHQHHVSPGPHPVASSPEGVMFSRVKILGPSLPPGSDSSGSMILTVDVTAVDGTFEIDSTCTDPANHLIFIEDAFPSVSHLPAFTKGVITVGSGPNSPPVALCQSVTVDANADCEAFVDPEDVDAGSYDPDGDPITLALEPSGPYALGSTPVRLIVTDDKGLADTCNATITVDDTTQPEINCPHDTTVNCVNDVPEPDPYWVTATDNCGSVTVDWRDDTPLSGGPCGGTITRTYRATDECGNFSECTQTITVNDTMPPWVTCPGPITIECESDVPDPDIATVTASDNCEGPVTVRWVSDGPLTGGPCGGTITRTYEGEDECGNTAQCTQIITVDDTTPPTVTCPGPISVQCESDVPAPNISLVTTSDNCGGPVTVRWVSDGPLTGGPCGGTITRTYEGEDECGNTALCTQIFTIFDEEDPQIIACPNDTTVQCLDDVPEPDYQLVSAIDNCRTPIVTWEGDTPLDGGPCGGTIYRTYRATDECGNTAECTQRITVDDTTPPTIIACANDTTVQCIEEVPPPNTALVAATDNCETPTITHVGDSPLSGGPCGGILRRYKATDACGNWVECAQRITVNDTVAPLITCPNDTTVAIYRPDTGAYVSFTAQAYDNCGDVTVQCTPPSGSFFGDSTTMVTCVATDTCENTKTCVFTVRVFAVCACPHQGDIEPDGFITALDLGAIVDILFYGAVDVQDPGCPSPRFDLDCDRFTTALDLAFITDHLFFGGPEPCDPCAS